MNFYTSIAEYYDQIFPYKPIQKTFIENFKGDGGQVVLLDIGCGTGSLIINLAEQFGTSIGIDPDKEMLQLAMLKSLKEKIDYNGDPGDPGKLVFLPKGMLELADIFAEQSIDLILCLGNTLVHLDSIDEVREMVGQCFKVLKPGGRLIIQIINYDRIFARSLPGLPTIENDGIRFERNYRYEPASTHISFQTRLHIEETGNTIDNEIVLLALRPNELRDILLESRFSNLEEFGNFKKESFTQDAEPYIVVVRRGEEVTRQNSERSRQSNNE